MGWSRSTDTEKNQSGYSNSPTLNWVSQQHERLHITDEANSNIIVDVSDKNRVRSDANAAKHVGEIRVTVFRKQILEQTSVETGGQGNNTNLEIAEKAVKGQTISHGTE